MSRRSRNSATLAAQLNNDTTKILATGGDSRQIIDPATDLTKYGCSMAIRTDAFEFGSCTASSTSATGFAAAQKLHQRLLALTNPDAIAEAVEESFRYIREEILFSLTRGLVPGVEIVLAPSGTDAELIALAFAGAQGRRVSNVLVGAGELGSGTALAASGCYFDTQLPSGALCKPGEAIDPDLADCVRLFNICLRDRFGGGRTEADIDSEVKEIVAEEVSEGRQVLLHVVAHSKTGLHAPSLAAVKDIRRKHGDAVMVVIDAAQGRFSRQGMIQALRSGCMVLTTGSKFYGGPSFAGALLIPAKLYPEQLGLVALPAAFGHFFAASQIPERWQSVRSGLPSRANLGLLLRWTAAAAEIREYYATPSELRFQALRSFEALVPRILGSSAHIKLGSIPEPARNNQPERLLQPNTTVFSFELRSAADRYLSLIEMRNVYYWMNNNVTHLLPHRSPERTRCLAPRIHTGQPVVLGPNDRGPVVLRLALSAVLIAQVAQNPKWGSSFEDRMHHLEDQLIAFKRKTEILVKDYETMTRASKAQCRNSAA